MSRDKRCLFLMASIVVMCLFSQIPVISAASNKIMVVMSYEEDNPWCIQIKEGIDSVLAGDSAIIYFYMDTKKNINGGIRKAEEAYELYKQLRPDGVIAADDNAQSMFVLPYLKDKVTTPVMFCAVNAEPEEYGYPASNVSGILERGFIRESIAFAKQPQKASRTTMFDPWQRSTKRNATWSAICSGVGSYTFRSRFLPSCFGFINQSPCAADSWP